MDRWYTVVPVNPRYNSKEVRLTKPLDLGHNVYFTIVGDRFNKLQGLDLLSFYQRELLKDTNYILISEYKPSSLGDPDPEWRGKDTRSKQAIALEKIQMANLALWLIKPSPINFELVLHVQEEVNKIIRESFSTGPLTPHERDKHNYLEIKEFEQAHKLSLILYGLQRTGAVWIAVRTLYEALTSTWWHIRFLLLWIALEALFGAETEITYRISQRIAFFLSSSKEEAAKLYTVAKEGYEWRSIAVHGMKLQDSKKAKREESPRVLYNTESFIRRSLVKILNSEELIKVFSSKKREEYLDNLIFSF